MEDITIELRTRVGEEGNHCSPLKESTMKISYFGGDIVVIKVGFAEHHIDKSQFNEALKMMKLLQIENTKVKGLQKDIFHLKEEINKLKKNDT